MEIDLATLVQATQGKVFSEVETQFSGIGTDTRKDLKKNLFIALKGESFDGHDYLQQAYEKGCGALLVHRFPEQLSQLRGKVTIVVVKDTLVALQDLAHFVRLQKHNTVVGITGSNGKTTTKEFTAAILSEKKRVHYSKGSFNNHWGVPFSILQQPQNTEIAVLEMGMNHAGEITQLCKIADPDIVICTTVGRAHIENFGSVEKIAEAKEEIYEAAPAKARRVYNLDNPFTQKMFLRSRTRFPKSDRILSFSQINPKADVFMQIEKASLHGLQVKGRILNTQGETLIPVLGEHNLTNIMAAAATALASGMNPEDIWSALIRCKTNWGRNQIVSTAKGFHILFDGYNANPDSMMALFQNVQSLNAKNKCAVLAQMLELGDHSADSHYEIGKLAAAVGFSKIWFYGPDRDHFAKGLKEAHYQGQLFLSPDFEQNQVAQFISDLGADDLIAVKGSRGMKLERFVLACDPVQFSLNKE